jgi:hypothetical protein
MRKDFLTRLLSSRYLVFTGLFFMVVDRLFSYFVYKVQLRWQAHFQQTNHLGYWWLITAGFQISEWIFLAALLLLLFRKHLRAIFQPPITSVFLDYFMAVALWGMSAVFSNPLLETYLTKVGLHYLSALFFWGGVLWIVVGFLRVKMLFVGRDLKAS